MPEPTLLVNWYCTRRHYAARDRFGVTERFSCGSGYGCTRKEFDRWQAEGYGNSNSRGKEWDKIPMCKTCLKLAGEGGSPTMTPPEYVYAIAEIISDFDLADEVFWHRGNGFMVPIVADGTKVSEKAPLVGAVVVNDVFWWATSDLEDIKPDDIPVLRTTLDEVGGLYGAALWVARKRGMRPQMAWIDSKHHRSDLDLPRDAFLAAGPERTRKEEG